MGVNEYDDMMSGGKPIEGNEYDSLMNAESEASKQNVKTNMFAAEKSDPARKAKVLNLSKQYNMPADFVDRNFDTLNETKNRTVTDYDSLIQENEGLASWLGKKENAELGKK